jgi:uncharacterized membrane protein
VTSDDEATGLTPSEQRRTRAAVGVFGLALGLMFVADNIGWGQPLSGAFAAVGVSALVYGAIVVRRARRRARKERGTNAGNV